MSRLQDLQGVFDSMVSELKLLNLPTLGPDFAVMDTPNLHQALVVHRATKKYEVRDEGQAALRKARTIERVLEADASQPVTFDYRALQPSVRRDFLHAKQWLADFFADFQHGYALRFPTGETYVSARGLTDLIHKLKAEQQWAVSPDLVRYTVNIIVRNRALANVVRHRFRQSYGNDGIRTLNKVVREYRKVKPNGNFRFVAFHFMFRACCTLNRVARLTTVPKDNQWDRAITCESLWNMVCQLSYGNSLRNHMRRKLGINLETLQSVHRALVRVADKATMDLKSASDTNLMCVLRDLWPIRQVRHLENMRTGVLELPSGAMHPLRMFAPMGCGCTFEVMTLTLLAHCRVLDKGASVFGDDIIIKSDSYDRLQTNLEAMRWVVNVSKSFKDGNFRESCGAFAALDSNTLLVSYDFERPTTIKECNVLAHKVLHLLKALKRGTVRNILRKAYVAYVQKVARDSWVPLEPAALRPTAGLEEDIVFVPARYMVYAAGVRSDEIDFRTGLCRDGSLPKPTVSNLISCFWHVPVRLQSVRDVVALTKPAKRTVDVVHYAAYMRRGTSYDLEMGRERTLTVQKIVGRGVPPSKVHLVTIIVT